MSTYPDSGVDAYALATWLNVAPATIRSWANRGKISTIGLDHHGRTPYDPAEVARHAKASARLAQLAEQLQH